MEAQIVVLVLLFFETTLVVGFAINGELVLVVAGAAAARGDGSVVTLIALAWAGALGYLVAEAVQTVTWFALAAVVAATAAFVIRARFPRRALSVRWT
jgi:membrane protein DedA with SNARE-associated domain